jgi:hypothetical protein
MIGCYNFHEIKSILFLTYHVIKNCKRVLYAIGLQSSCLKMSLVYGPIINVVHVVLNFRLFLV